MVKKEQLARGPRREEELGLAEGRFRLEASAFLSWEETRGSQAASGVLVLETQTSLQFACHETIEEDFKLIYSVYCLTLGKAHPVITCYSVYLFFSTFNKLLSF